MNHNPSSLAERFPWIIRVRLVAGASFLLFFGLLRLAGVLEFPFWLFSVAPLGAMFLNQPWPAVVRRFRNPSVLFFLNQLLDIVLITWGLHFAGGMNLFPLVLAYPLVFVFTGTVLERHAALWMANLSFVAYGLLVYLEYSGILPPVPVFDIQMSGRARFFQVVALFPFFNLIAYFASFLTSALRDSIRKRDQAEAELREERRGLEEKVTLRTAEIERAREEIRNYARRLEETNEELRQFSSAASHDLQEPLLNILYLCDFLEPRIQALHDAGISQDVNRIRQTARRLQILVKGLLDYARFSQEEETPEKSAIAIDDILTEIKKDFEVRIQELQARVEWGKMPRVYAHRLRVRQLFQNLISNALKYHRAGVAPVIEIKAEPQDGGIAVHVTDNGVGFDPAHKEELFQPFKRLHQESIPQGSGIGLALCQKIALRYGWQLMAEGRPGEGASFTIVFPAGDIAGS